MHRVLGIALVVGLLGGCGGHAREGDICTDGLPTCQDKQTALFCGSDGTYRAFPCPGPGGCEGKSMDGTTVIACDIQGTKSGDNCPEYADGAVYCQSAHSALVCGGDIWRLRDCPDHCTNGVFGVGQMESTGECF